MSRIATNQEKIMIGDFETCATSEENTQARVWASCCVSTLDYSVTHLGNSIEDFLNYIKEFKSIIYFHNLAFDGKFIIPQLFKMGFRQATQAEVDFNNTKCKIKPKTFDLVADEMGNFYKLTIYWEKKKERKGKVKGQYKYTWIKTDMLDSVKCLPMSVASMAKKFLGLKEKTEQKGSIDYERIRLSGYCMTEEEKEYIIKDCLIVAKGINKLHEEGMNKATVSGNAFQEFLKVKFLGDKKAFRRLLPELDLETDEYIRKSYKGGWTYCNPVYRNRRVDNQYGVTLDVNSLYPSVMYKFPMPYGTPVKFEGEYEEDKGMPLFIQRVFISSFKLKENKYPCIQIKGNSRFSETEYLSEGQEVELTLTNIDLELIRECYHLSGVTFIDGYKFRSISNLFKEYIEYWTDIKKNAPNDTLRQIAKLMLNSLYGKFASKMVRTPSRWFINEKGILSKELLEEDNYCVAPYFTALGSFITAYARRETITGANNNYETFMYADTDSLHLAIHLEDAEDIPLDVDWENTGDLGLWKLELVFSDSLYLGAKKYMEYGFEYMKFSKIDETRLQDERDSKWDVKCAGLPEDAREKIQSKEKFKIGEKFKGAKKKVNVIDGVLLLETEFSIKN